jgi:hypothetical protein
LLIYLHTQTPLKLADWTVVDAIAGVVDHSAFPSITRREGKTHLDIPGRRSATIHELIAFFHILYENSLLDRLVDNELIANEVILNLGQWLVEHIFPNKESSVMRLTLSAFIQVNRFGSSGSFRVVSMYCLLPMYMGEILRRLAWAWSQRIEICTTRSCPSNLIACFDLACW